MKMCDICGVRISTNAMKSCAVSSCLVLWAQVQNKVEELLEGKHLDAVICVAGGWAGGNAKNKSDNIVLYSLTLSLPRMINVKIPLQPYKKYDITQYGELDFS